MPEATRPDPKDATRPGPGLSDATRGRVLVDGDYHPEQWPEEVVRKGRAWYVSTLPEPAEPRGPLARMATDAGARPALDGLPDGVEAVRRGEVLFVLDHGRDEITVDVPGTHRDLLTGATVTGSPSLRRYGVAVLTS